MSHHAKPFHQNDLPAIEHALAQWITTAGDCGYLHPGEIAQRIYPTGAHAPPVSDLARVWKNGDTVTGFSIHARYGHAFDVYTAPAYCNTALEREMLHTAATATAHLMAQSGSDQRTVITDVWACDTVRQQLLESLGFRKYRVWTFLTQRALSAPLPQPQLPPGFYPRAAPPGYAEALAAVHGAAFGQSIDHDAYREHLTRTMNSTVYVVVAPDERFAAFAWVHLDAVNGVGLFEPVGTHPDFQRRGLARALLLYGMAQMKNAGMHTARVGHTVTNTAAYRLYYRLGFRVKHHIYGYVRQIAEGG